MWNWSKALCNLASIQMSKIGTDKRQYSLLSKKVFKCISQTLFVDFLKFNHILGQANVVELLLNHGANASIRNCEGFSPLYLAVRNGWYWINFIKILTVHIYFIFFLFRMLPGADDVIDVLLKNNTEINSPNINGMTPFHISVVMSMKLIARNIKRLEWKSISLFCFVLLDRVNITSKFIENGARINSITHLKKTALNLAAELGEFCVFHFKNKIYRLRWANFYHL